MNDLQAGQLHGTARAKVIQDNVDPGYITSTYGRTWYRKIYWMPRDNFEEVMSRHRFFVGPGRSG